MGGVPGAFCCEIVPDFSTVTAPIGRFENSVVVSVLEHALNRIATKEKAAIEMFLIVFIFCD